MYSFTMQSINLFGCCDIVDMGWPVSILNTNAGQERQNQKTEREGGQVQPLEPTYSTKLWYYFRSHNIPSASYTSLKFYVRTVIQNT